MSHRQIPNSWSIWRHIEIPCPYPSTGHKSESICSRNGVWPSNPLSCRRLLPRLESEHCAKPGGKVIPKAWLPVPKKKWCRKWGKWKSIISACTTPFSAIKPNLPCLVTEKRKRSNHLTQHNVQTTLQLLRRQRIWNKVEGEAAGFSISRNTGSVGSSKRSLDSAALANQHAAVWAPTQLSTFENSWTKRSHSWRVRRSFNSPKHVGLNGDIILEVGVSPLSMSTIVRCTAMFSGFTLPIRPISKLLFKIPLCEYPRIESHLEMWLGRVTTSSWTMTTINRLNRMRKWKKSPPTHTPQKLSFKKCMKSARPFVELLIISFEWAQDQCHPSPLWIVTFNSMETND